MTDKGSASITLNLRLDHVYIDEHGAVVYVVQMDGNDELIEMRSPEITDQWHAALAQQGGSLWDLADSINAYIRGEKDRIE